MPDASAAPDPDPYPTMNLTPVPRLAPGPDSVLAAGAPPEGEAPGEPRASGRRRKALLLAAIGAAAVAVLGVAGFAGGLFSGSEREDRRTPDEISTWLPSSAGESSEEPSESAAPSPTASSESPAPVESPAAETTPSVRSATSSAPPPSPKESAASPSGPAASTSATGSDGVRGATLKRGDSGDEVTELQYRLTWVGMYYGQPNGEYDQAVEDSVRRYQQERSVPDDPAGVYGPRTRAALEAETPGYGRGYNRGQGYR